MKGKGKKKIDGFSDTDEKIDEFISMFNELPNVKPPRKFERTLYRKLGISYTPFYRKALFLGGVSVVVGTLYVLIQRFYNLILSRFSLELLLKQFSSIYAKAVELISLIKIGKYLEDVFFAFVSPWMVFGFAFVSSILILIFVKLAKRTTRSDAVLIRF